VRSQESERLFTSMVAGVKIVRLLAGKGRRRATSLTYSGGYRPDETSLASSTCSGVAVSRCSRQGAAVPLKFRRIDAIDPDAGKPRIIDRRFR
jgi:hypothetical protein